MTSPPDCLAKPKTWDSPSPVPWPTPFVVKNGSKIRSSASGAMPLPVSVTETATKSPRMAGWARTAGTTPTGRTGW